MGDTADGTEAQDNRGLALYVYLLVHKMVSFLQCGVEATIHSSEVVSRLSS